jgi:hypothetical protein
MQNGFVNNESREFKLGKDLSFHINHLIQVMSEIQTNLPLNLCNLNSSWDDSGGAEGDVVYQ